MPNLTVLLDELVELAAKDKNNEPKASKAAALCEMAGAGGIGLEYTSENFNSKTHKIIEEVKAVAGIPLVVLVQPENKYIEKAIELKPSMILIRNCPADNADFIAKIQVANIIAALEVQPEISQVKLAAKMKADYVALDTTEYCQASSLSEKIDRLSRLEKAASVAQRLSMGAFLIGPMNLADINKLAKIDFIEDFFVGHEVIASAALLGLEQSIKRIKQEIQ